MPKPGAFDTLKYCSLTGSLLAGERAMTPSGAYNARPMWQNMIPEHGRGGWDWSKYVM